MKLPRDLSGPTCGASRRRDHSTETYGEARQRERDVVLPDGTTHDGRTRAHWPRVALIVAKRTGHKVGPDTATRMAMDAPASRRLERILGREQPESMPVQSRITLSGFHPRDRGAHLIKLSLVERPDEEFQPNDLRLHKPEPHFPIGGRPRFKK